MESKCGMYRQTNVGKTLSFVKASVACPELTYKMTKLKNGRTSMIIGKSKKTNFNRNKIEDAQE